MVLNPLDRLTEVLYGIILVLTFTGTLRVATQGDIFATGAKLGRYTGTSPLWEGMRFMAAGAALVAITIALGG
jgi:hypothetical protein